jgi:hypothetical protein
MDESSRCARVLGAAAAGCRPIWLRGIHPWPPDHPVPAWQIGALPELVALVQQERSPTTCSGCRCGDATG